MVSQSHHLLPTRQKMAPRVPPGPAAANDDPLTQLRGRAIRKPKLSKTPISDVFLKACEDEDFKKINACLTLGVDINCKGSDNHSALYHSLYYGKEKLFEFLIKHPELDVDEINQERILWAACVKDRKDQLRKICDLPGIDVNAGQPLKIAALLNDLDGIRILAENPALDWNCGGYHGDHPLIAALGQGHVEVVKILLSQPTLSFKRTEFDSSSVGHHAVEYRQLRQDRLLKRKGLNESACPVKCVELLSKDPRINWNVRNENGETPIMLALKYKEMEMVKILLKTPGVDVRDIAKMREGDAILKEMLQKTEEENRQLPSKVPDCPVSNISIL